MVLQRGSSGEDVTALQKQLNAAGYNLDEDGVFGAKTQAAVKDYQTKNNLQVDGKVGSQTSASLAGLTPVSASPVQDKPNVASYTPIDNSGMDYATEYGMSDADKQTIASLQAVYANATDDNTKASLHNAAETIRNSYGYSGGDDGSAGVAVGIPASYAQQAQERALQAQKDSEARALQARQQAEQLSTMLQEYKDLYSNQSNAYAAALEEQKKAQQAAVDRTVGGLNNQKFNTETAYGDLFRQLYLDKMKQQKNIDQRLAAAGQTGGQAESTLLGLATSYEDALREGGISKEAALRQIDQAISDAQLTGDISTAEMAAQMAQSQADNYATALRNLIERSDNIAYQDLARADNIAQQEAARIDAQNATNRSYAYQTAMAILQSGNMASDELLNSAGISKADASAIIAGAVAAKKQVDPEPGNDTLKKAAETAWVKFVSGDRSDEVISTLETYYNGNLSTIAKQNGIIYSSSKVPYADNVVKDPTSLDYQPDEGVFIWNGRLYNNLSELESAIDAVKLTNSQKSVLKNKFKTYGFNISF